LIFGLWILEII